MPSRDFALEYPDFKNFINFLNQKYSGVKNSIDPLNFYYPTTRKVMKAVDLKSLSRSFFKGRHVELPTFSISSPFEIFTRLEDFTSVSEVTNISLWALSVLDFLTDKHLLLGKELEVIQSSNPRDGRLDVVVSSNELLLVLETKNTLKSALAEKRFEYQILNYKDECVEQIAKAGLGLNFTILLNIGGDETDIYPPDHEDCITGKVGNMAEIFYAKILKNNIKFISANSMWALLCCKVVENIKFDFDNFFANFNRPEVIGLLSGGFVIYKDNTFKVESISLGN